MQIICRESTLETTFVLAVITGSALVLHCCKAHSNINRKMGISTSCKIVTPKNFNLKLCTHDYVGEATHQANVGSNRYSRGFSPYRRNITTLWLFLLTVLSCPVLFFSGTRPGRTAEPIFTLYGSNDVFPRKEVPFGGLGWCVTSSGGNMPPKPPKMGVNRQFQAKTAKYKKLQYLRNYESDQDQIWGPTSDQQLHFVGGLMSSRWNRYDVITPPRVVRFWQNMAGQSRMTCPWRKLGKNRNRK